jgi:type IV pilus assembly protein PilC
MPMTTFEYAVRDRSGKLVKGTLDAENQSQVVTKLRTMGFAPVSITEANAGMKRELTIPGFGGKVKLKDLAIMARQFATMIASGLSLLRSLTILAEQTENKELSRVLGLSRADVESGQSLSSALAKFPRVFPPLMINMVRAGEVGGFLDQVLLQVADNFEAEVKLKGKIKSAMTYPVVVFCIAIVALIGMLIFIVPVFAGLFTSLNATMPAPTRFLVTLSHGMKFILPILIVAGVGGSITWGRIKHQDNVRSVVDPLKLKLPVFGSLAAKIALSRFSRNLGTMLKSGVPILQSLDIVGETAGNMVIKNAAQDVRDSVRNGESLSGPLANHKIFPPMVVQMMEVGEETGALDTMLYKISDFYDQEVEATTEALTSLIEPLMIVFIGGVVGAMIIALYLPIFSVMSAIH